jgi:hypothetical protein
MANKGFIFITRPNFRLIVSRFEVWPVAKICHSIDGSRQRLHEPRTISDRIGVRILRLEIRHITKVTHLRSTARSAIGARAYNRPRKREDWVIVFRCNSDRDKTGSNNPPTGTLVHFW